MKINEKNSGFGGLYGGGRTRIRREWRGPVDTAYDFFQWIKNWVVILKQAMRPQFLKGLFRYRWVVNYVAATDFVDRSMDGLRGRQLRIAHTTYDFLVAQIVRSLSIMFSADQNIGGSKAQSDRMIVFDENMMEQLAFGFPKLIRACPQVLAVFALAAVSQHSQEHYIDRAEEYGITGDACTMPKAELGLCLEDETIAVGKCYIHCNTTCDTSLMGNGIEDRHYRKPSFFLAAAEYLEDPLSRTYTADEIRAAIHFIEEQTGDMWDWKAYFENMRMFNEQTRIFLEIMDLEKTDYPQITENLYALYREIYYTRMLNASSAELLNIEKKVQKLMLKGYDAKDRLCAEPRHRALIWGVQAEFYSAFPNWLLSCWGILGIIHFMNLTSTELYADEDTPQNREQAMLDLADLTCKMIMRNRSEGGYRYGVDDIWRFCEEFHTDMIICYEQISCKALAGYHGIYEDEATRRGIHLIWVTHSLLDPRKASRQNMRDEVNRYMHTVLQEEPVDPKLEVIADGSAW